jgi:poly(A)-specific ribonuclease
MIQEEEARSRIADMELKPEDDALIHHIRSSVTQWQAQPKEQQEAYLNIPGEADGVPHALNGYQIRLTHQVVRKEYPNLKTVSMKHFVQITNPTAEQQASEKLLRTQQREKQIMEAVGFRWLMEAIFAGNISGLPNAYIVNGLSSRELNGKSPKEFIYTLQEKLRSRRRIMVGHNCFTDLVNLYKCFIGDLPSTVEVFTEEIHTLLPGVMDTKYIASFGSKRWANTSLEEVEVDLRTEPLPRIDVPAEYDRYLQSSTYHEAGYDSLITARIAIKLSAKMERERKYLDLQNTNILGDAPLQAAFGVDDDGYVTAAESVHSQVSSDFGVATSITNALISPVTAFKAFFDTNEISPGKEPIHNEGKQASGSNPTKQKSETVIAVKGRDRSMKWTNKNEVAKIKDALAKTNIYDVLEQDQPGPEVDSGDDLMSFSSGSESGSPTKGKNLDAMVKKGEVMPPWDGANGFWKTFGNKLQVNGSQEGECRIV